MILHTAGSSRLNRGDLEPHRELGVRIQGAAFGKGVGWVGLREMRGVAVKSVSVATSESGDGRPWGARCMKTSGGGGNKSHMKQVEEPTLYTSDLEVSCSPNSHCIALRSQDHHTLTFNFGTQRYHS